MKNQLDIIDIQDRLGYVDTGSIDEHEATPPLRTMVASSSTADLIIKEPKPQVPYTAYTNHMRRANSNGNDLNNQKGSQSEQRKGKEPLLNNNRQPQTRSSRFIAVNSNGNNNEDPLGKPKGTSTSLPATAAASPQNEPYEVKDVMVSKLNEIAEMLKLLTVQQHQQLSAPPPPPPPPPQGYSSSSPVASSIMSSQQPGKPTLSKSNVLRRKPSKGKLNAVYHSNGPHYPSPNRKVLSTVYGNLGLEPSTPLPASTPSYPSSQQHNPYALATIAPPTISTHHYYKGRKSAVPYYRYNGEGIAADQEEEDHYQQQHYDHSSYYHQHHYYQPYLHYYYQQPPPAAPTPVSHYHYDYTEQNEPSVFDYYAPPSSERPPFRQRRKSLSSLHETQVNPTALQRKSSQKSSLRQKRPTSAMLYDLPAASKQQQSLAYLYPPQYMQQQHYQAPVPVSSGLHHVHSNQPYQYSPTRHHPYGYYI
ncbi:hypothetical protein BDF20DRAFT_875126 [Mycotypha africana]|uniref:uncharacterized protein n=1 Tax=Mycotypha africana TaxID=64632 RepID=UPI002300CF1B|nr:uncharacterized protein BDF20DRAFT_875126 [Mycotypha africana]KAI8977482.1 hypothetical protein BDF20DRAFT_875126 [Mycotypha africana]